MVGDGEQKRPSFAKKKWLPREVMRRRGDKDFVKDTHSILELQKLRLDSLLGKEGVLARVALNNELERVAKRVDQGNLDEVEGFVLLGGDIDDLKGVNDIGKKHKAGDAVVVNAGVAMASSLRIGVGDRIGRYGGDEFLGIAPVEKSNDHPDPKVFAEEMMLGGDENKGRIKMIEEKVAEGLVRLRKEHKMPDNPRAGAVSLGWLYVGREEFVAAFQKSESDPDTDFVGTLFSMVDERIYIGK